MRELLVTIRIQRAELIVTIKNLERETLEAGNGQEPPPAVIVRSKKALAELRRFKVAMATLVIIGNRMNEPIDKERCGHDCAYPLSCTCTLLRLSSTRHTC